jgi:hypothetical protein
MRLVFISAGIGFRARSTVQLSASAGPVPMNSGKLYGVRPIIKLVNMRFEPNDSLKAVRASPTQSTSAKVTIVASVECSDDTCLHSGDCAVVEMTKGVNGDYFKIEPDPPARIKLALGGAVDASFEVTVAGGTPAGTYDFTFHILDVKRGSDNKSILDTIQLSPETAMLEKELQVTN